MLKTYRYNMFKQKLTNARVTLLNKETKDFIIQSSIKKGIETYEKNENINTSSKT